MAKLLARSQWSNVVLYDTSPQPDESPVPEEYKPVQPFVMNYKDNDYKPIRFSTSDKALSVFHSFSRCYFYFPEEDEGD